jgi:hypothetical protein
MSFKENLQKRIEKNAIKIPNVSWIDKNGVHTEDIVIKRSKMPLIGDWARIYPPLDENGKINWINTIFGGYKNFIKVLLMLGIIALFILGYYDVFTQYELLQETCVQLK